MFADTLLGPGAPAPAGEALSMLDRRSLVLGTLFGAALGAVALGLALSGSLPSASAEDPPVLGGPKDPADPIGAGPTVNPATGPNVTRATGGGAGTFAMGGANQTAIALSAPAGGDSVVYYFDTHQQRLLVYQYQVRGDKSGLKLLAARHFDYDLKLEDYGTSPTRTELKAAYDAFAKAGGEPPAKRVEINPGR
jgi:hypothetical protein